MIIFYKYFVHYIQIKLGDVAQIKISYKTFKSFWYFFQKVHKKEK